MLDNKVAIIQARSGSKRFKNKILSPLSDTTVIGYMLRRLSGSRLIDKVIVAIPENDIELENLIKSYNTEVFKGSELNVLQRIYLAAKYYNAKIVIRLTADCPLIDPELIDEMLTRYLKEKPDYLGFGNKPSYPDGLGTEIFSYKALEIAYRNAEKSEELEHVTQYIRNNREMFSQSVHFNSEDFSHIRITVDYPQDIIVIRNIVDALDTKNDAHFCLNDIVNLYQTKPELFLENKELSQFNYLQHKQFQ